MAFFPRVFVHEQGFNPLFQLLNDLDTVSREAPCQAARSHHRRQHQVRTFNPRFDVRETDAAYELHGELPGVDRENLQIEFTDPQTIVIRGRVERTYTAGTPPAAPATVEAAEPAADDNIADDFEQIEATNDTASVSHKTTVEDEETEAAKEAGTPAETQEVAKPAEQPAEQQKPADRYWLSERSIGQFTRSFNFSARVEQEAVSANLKDGILSVVVPKAKKHEARRISIE